MVRTHRRRSGGGLPRQRRVTANDGEYAYTYYDGDTLLGCATVEEADAVYGACGVVYDDDAMLDLHQAIKDAVG